MTTKKSKPASLTSSLLARKGEAEPAAAPYSIPESGRQRPAESMVGKGNGNGGDLGHALSGMTRLPAGEHEPKAGAPDSNGTPAAAISPPERQPARIVPPAPQATPRFDIPETRPHGPELVGPEHASPEQFSAEEVFVESAMPEEVSVDEAVIEAAAPSSELPAPRPPAGTSASAPDAKQGGTGGTGSDDGAADREAVRDARLLRFVYVMAALTGIVAIVLYAGGWLREGPKKHGPDDVIATGPQTTTPDAVAKTETPPSGADKSAASETPAIPPAPPVMAPGMTESKPGAPETTVTTGGPPKPQADSIMGAAPGTPAPSELPAGAAVKPAMPALTPGETQQAAKPDGGSASSAGETPKSPDMSGAAEQPAPPKVTAPSDESASGKAVRDVPNMRVLAPALVKPEPAEGAPAAKSETGGVPVVTPPTVNQTAAVPKIRPPKHTGAATSGHFLVQLASVGSEKIAEREWTRLQKAFPDVFSARELVIEKKEIAGRGTFYRVQSGGFTSLDDARDVCNTLKAKKQACLPVKR